MPRNDFKLIPPFGGAGGQDVGAERSGGFRVIEVLVNGESRRLDESSTIDSLITALELGTDGIAVELNREIVPRRDHSTTLLRDGDRIEIVTLVGGG